MADIMLDTYRYDCQKDSSLDTRFAYLVFGNFEIPCHGYGRRLNPLGEHVAR